MVLPLDGMKVIELGAWVVGPTCGRILGELGAEVIKVEDPEGGDPARGVISPAALAEADRGLGPVSPWWEQWNSSKRAIAVDLSQERGKEIMRRLLERADVFVTNLRAAAVERLGFDYESVRKVNPKIIYAQNTGFGPKGPQRNRAAFDDTTFWIRSGIMSTLGEPDAPPVPLRGAMGDLTTAVFLTGAIVTALLARERFGFGQKLDTSLLASGMWVTGEDIQRRLIWGEREGNPKFSRKNAPNPLRNTYRTKDRKWLFFMMLQTDRFWPAVCKAIEREDLEKDPRFDTHANRVKNSQSIISILDKVLATRTLAEWAERFDRFGLVWEPETTIAEVLADPQVAENNYVAEIQHSSGQLIKMLRIPFQLSEMPIVPRNSAPELGQHTEEVLLELGYNWEEIAQLKNEKIIN
jgi:crotonobetainyl-CoA:carnitine CoA-transferase CaiB-like acyl-CoA transferase